MNQEKIGKFIAELRKEKNITQEELADILGVNVRSVSRWENGKTMPDLSLLPMLAKELNIEVSELLNGRRMTKEELVELKDTIERLIEYGQNEIIDKSKIWQLNLKIGWCILFLAILNNYLHFLGIIFTPNAADFVQGALYGIGIGYELICVYNVTRELTLKEKQNKCKEKK
ncbi:MAG: helix-turn-helix transcriptional regulator [Bacilli bacterium]|nr:helix-turn-helix transcriptional regulator [Bacilli bacterium]MDE6141572.1 helix-turn-helix transcriptional regulator [Bacilli bacterium]